MKYKDFKHKHLLLIHPGVKSPAALKNATGSNGSSNTGQGTAAAAPSGTADANADDDADADVQLINPLEWDMEWHHTSFESMKLKLRIGTTRRSTATSYYYNSERCVGYHDTSQQHVLTCW